MKCRHIHRNYLILCIITVIILILCICGTRHGFSSDEQWIKTIDGTHGAVIRQTDDGKYMLIGTNPDETVSVILNLDEDGEYIWGLRFSDIKFTFIQHTNDGNYIICGIYEDSILILKIDQSGDIIWTRKSDIAGYPCSIQQFDDTYLVVGHMATTKSFVSKLNNDGIPIWTKTFEYYKSYEFHSIQQTTKGYMVVGNHWSESIYWGDTTYSTMLSIISIDNDGILIWHRWVYIGDAYPSKRSITRVNENEYVLTAQHYEIGKPIVLLKIDINGTNLWAKTFPGFNRFENIQHTSDNGIIIVGQDYTFETLKRALIIKTDEYGNVNWAKVYGGASELTYRLWFYDRANFVQETNDDGYIVIGKRSIDERKMLILKLDSLGDVNIHGKGTLDYQFTDIDVKLLTFGSITSTSIILTLAELDTDLDRDFSSEWRPSIEGDNFSLVSFTGYLIIWIIKIVFIGIAMLITPYCGLYCWSCCQSCPNLISFRPTNDCGGSGLPISLGTPSIPSIPTKIHLVPFGSIPMGNGISRSYMPTTSPFGGMRF
jgi:hypothetical protein